MCYSRRQQVILFGRIICNNNKHILAVMRCIDVELPRRPEGSWRFWDLHCHFYEGDEKMEALWQAG